jgi:hypothetical protein
MPKYLIPSTAVLQPSMKKIIGLIPNLFFSLLRFCRRRSSGIFSESRFCNSSSFKYSVLNFYQSTTQTTTNKVSDRCRGVDDVGVAGSHYACGYAESCGRLSLGCASLRKAGETLVNWRAADGIERSTRRFTSSVHMVSPIRRSLTNVVEDCTRQNNSPFLRLEYIINNPGAH